MKQEMEQDAVRALIREAIDVEWHRRIAEQTADTPAGHIDALTDAVMASLAEAREPGAHPWQEYNEHGNTCQHPGCRLTEDEHPEGGG
ncbi:hypothetical protein [Verrucosispora sp. WMMD1129]|uniref:hypothetical protein n=1 Tax=Verrucosispora sp. WMMD1129 TaxID=3016093 RepID=UPI00249BB4EE|nr:hypothetical protein [Verrucosispora sp. WMMD1129]WFE45307.1 hypothetical protein O7624_13580 [Verrucosispora sp. WMMD1129]